MNTIDGAPKRSTLWFSFIGLLEEVQIANCPLLVLEDVLPVQYLSERYGSGAVEDANRSIRVPLTL